MGTEQNREAALSGLLTEMFDGDGAGLLRWARLHLGKRIHDELSTGASLGQLAFETTLAIQRHGLARQAFGSLSEERPGQAERIREVALLWGLIMEVATDSGHAADRNPLATPTRLGRLWEVPELPPHYLVRANDVEQLERTLLEPGGGAVGITGMGQSSHRGADKHGLYGMGGLGKSVLAAAIARQLTIRERFPDGIVWISMGQTPQLALLQAQLCRALGHAEVFDSISDGTRRLRELAADQAILLILDDVWDATHAQALDVIGRNGRMLVTTRDLEVLTWLDAREHCVDVLDSGQALALLADWTQIAEGALPPAAAEVARSCGYLPLALAMIGALVRRGRTWAQVQTWLDEAQLVRIQGKVPAYPYRNVLQAVDASVTALAAEHEASRQCYIDLAVFPEDTPIPRSALRLLWSRHGLHTADADALADTLSDRALARRDEADRVMLHDLQRLYARSQVEDLAALHSALVDAYLARRVVADHRDDRYAGFDDGYVFQRLPWHLAEVNRHDELAALLFDFDWLDAKLQAAGIVDLLADFTLLPASHAVSREAKLVHDALRLSSHVLVHDARQLPGQLIGRLGGPAQGHARIAALLSQTRSMTRYRWLCPVTPSLTPPGGMLRILVGHAQAVNAVVVTLDGQHALSASDDGTLKLWDLEQGTELRSLVGHDCKVTAVAVTPDGRLVVSGSDDGTLKLWDLDHGTALRSLAGHADRVTVVAVAGDGRRAISVSRDGIVKLWDLDQGTELRSLVGQARSVNAVAVTPEGQRAIWLSARDTLKLCVLDQGAEFRTLGESGGVEDAIAVTPDGRRAILAWREWNDGLLTLWDVEQGTELHLQGVHRVRIDVVAMTPDGRRAISASGDGTVKLWNLDQGTELCSLAGGASWFNAMAMTPDGQRVVSGSRDGTLMLWDVEQGAHRRSPAGRSGSYVSVTITPDGRRAVSASGDGVLKLWDLEHGTELRTLTVDLTADKTWIIATTVTPDGRHAIWTRRDSILQPFSASSTSLPRGKQSWTIRDSLLESLGIYGGTELCGLSTLRLLDMDQGTELRRLTVGEWLEAMAVTPDGRRAVVAAYGTVKLWDLDQGTESRSLAIDTGIVRHLALTPDGRRAVLVSELLDFEQRATRAKDATYRIDYRILTLWDLEQDIGLYNSPPVFHSVTAIAVTPDGRRAVLGGHHGGTLMLWAPEEGTELRMLAGHAGVIWDVAVTSDGQHALSASEDHTLKLWNLDAGQVLATFTADSEIAACTCSPTMPIFVAVDRLGRIHILELVEPGDGA
jgi:WD40 repeat protein